MLNLFIDQRDSRKYDFVNVQRQFFRSRALCESADLRDDVACPIGVFDKTSNRFPCLVKIGRLSREPLQTSISVYHSRSEWLIDLVGNRGG